MALSADGQLFTWGWNGDGELGNGSSVSFTNVPVAVDMTGVLAGKTIAALGAGNMHFLVATTDGEVFAWGFGPDGELGNGETKDSRVPVAVNMSGALAGKSVVAVSGGWEHSMALTADGLVYTWGANYEGQLGTGTFASSAVPVAVDTTGVLAGQTIAAIAGGEEHGLALSAAGQVYGWGDGSRGELGDGNNSSSAVPIDSSAFAPLAGHTVVSLCGWYFASTVLTADGEVFSSSLLAAGFVALPTLPGFTVTAVAANSQAFEVVAMTLGVSAPVFVSPTQATMAYGQPSSFTVVAPPATGFSASPLPDWLSLDLATGILSGTPSSCGSWNLSIVASNVFGSTTQSLTLAVVHPPVAVDDNLGTVLNQSVEFSASKLAANDIDVDGNPLTVTAVSSSSTAGGSVYLQDGPVTSVIYTPPFYTSGPDSFTYTVSDSYGNTATGNVWVSIATGNDPSLNVVYGPVLDPVSGDFVVRFAGAPGNGYPIEYSDSLDSPNWQPDTFAFAPNDNSSGLGAGVFELDEPAEGATSRYYRTDSSGEGSPQPPPNQ